MKRVSSGLKLQPFNGLATFFTSLFVIVLFAWSFDTATFRDVLDARRLSRRFETPGPLLKAPLKSEKSLVQNETRLDNASSAVERVNQTIETAAAAPQQVSNGSPNGDGVTADSEKKPEWIRFPDQEKETETLLRRLAENGTKPCHAVATARIVGLELGLDRPLELRSGIVHRFLFTAFDEKGEPRCSGGDYFETDLSGPSWKSRPPVTDLGNGSYSMSLQVDPRFAAGLYSLKIVLLFGNYNGLHRRRDGWARREEMLSVAIKFVAAAQDSIPGPPLKVCSGDDYRAAAWSGRWTRSAHKDPCKIDSAGRFRCLDPEEPCKNPWCDGAVGLLESNGWVYSAHCSFKIYKPSEAWDCLDGKWLFFWGDSNHVDTIRNLLNFVLELWNVKAVPRRFDETFVKGSKRVRITSVFNGHWNETLNYQGIHSLANADFRDKLRQYFAGDRLPDFMIMNSGLHDGVYWRNVGLFAKGAEEAAEFWDSVMKSVDDRKKKRPVLLYRTTIATGGYARSLWYNPQKMETYNHILLEKFREKNLVSMVVDGFDLTYPWHYDNNCSDGVHYGRAPARTKWHGQIGHQYFVDLMLVHILLTAICVV
jgi:hypothetical protein